KGFLTMKRGYSRLLLSLLLAAATAAPALAVRRTEDPLGLVPADAVTVGVVHWDALRSSPLAARVFADVDHISGDGDGARFLAETGLTPREDIDTFVIAMSAGPSGSREAGLVLFEGRFDLARIGKALTARGATLLTSAGGGAYYRLAEKGGEPGAGSLVQQELIILRDEDGLAAAAT